MSKIEDIKNTQAAAHHFAQAMVAASKLRPTLRAELLRAFSEHYDEAWSELIRQGVTQYGELDRVEREQLRVFRAVMDK